GEEVGCVNRLYRCEEGVERSTPMVSKKDGRREPYDRLKIIAGLKKACEKRPVSMEVIEDAADRVEAAVLERGGKEVPSSFIGGAVMKELDEIDQVAYVRFWSVYRSFKDIEEFMRELEDLISSRRREEQTSPPPPRKDKDGGSAA